MSSRRAPRGSAGSGADDPSESSRSPAGSLTCLPPEMTDGHSVGYPTGYGAQAKAGQADWSARLDACVRAGFECYRELHDLHEVLFHHAHPVRSDPPLATLVIRDLLAAGVAAGALDLSDPESTAVLCFASMHAFDLRGHGGPDDARLIRAAQQLVRRAARLP